MGNSVGALRVDLSANAAQFGRDLGAAREHLRRTGSAFQSVGGIAGSTGEQMARGLKRGINDFRELGDAAGLAGGPIARLGGQVADLALGGFNPLSIAIVGISFALGAMTDTAKESLEVKIPESTKRTISEIETLHGSIRDLKNELAAMQYGGNVREIALEGQVKEQAALVRKTREQTEINKIEEEYSRILKTIAELKAAGYQEDSDAVRRQQRLLELMKDQFQAANQLVEPEERKLEALRKQLDLTKKISDEQQAGARKLRQIEDNIASSKAARAKVESDARARVATYIKSAKDEDAEIAQLRVAQAISYKTYSAEVLKDLTTRKVSEADINKILDARGAKLAHNAALEREAAGYNPGFAETLKDDSQQERVRNFSTELAAMRHEMELTDQLGVAMAHRLTEGLSGDVAGAFIDAAKGTKSLKSAVGDLAESVLTDLTRMIIQAIIFRSIMSAIGLTGVAPTSTAPGAGPPNPNTFSATSMDFHKSAPVIEFHDHVGVQKSAQASTDPDGRKRIKIMIAEAVAEDVLSGGKVAQATRDAFGLSRIPRRRG